MNRFDLRITQKHNHSRIWRSTGLLLVALAVSLGLGPVTAHAAPISMSSSIWSYGDEITLNGDDLEGLYPRRKQLCLAPAAQADKNLCFGHYDQDNKVWISDDPLILQWDSDQIRFKVPSGAPINGVVKLYRTYTTQKCFGTAGCDDFPEENATVVGEYKATPTITSVVDSMTGEVPTSLRAGRSYTIKGVFFGPTVSSILIGTTISSQLRSDRVSWDKLSTTEVASWGSESIKFTPKSDHDFSLGLKVNNGFSDSNAFAPSASPAKSASSSSTASSASVSSSSSQNASTPAFSDIGASVDYAPAIDWAKSAGIVSGYSDGTFRPDQLVNRAEFLKIVLGASTAMDSVVSSSARLFRDVDPLAWYSPYLKAAQARGIIGGYPDGTFRPDHTVSLAEGLKMAYLTLGIPTSPTTGAWYQPFFNHATAHNVMYAGDTSPTSGLTRRDVVWIIWRLKHL